MGEAGQPRADRASHGVVVGLAVACRDDHAGRDQGSHITRLDAFGSERHQRLPVLRRAEQRDGVLIDPAQMGGVVDAAPREAQERPLDVNTEHARYACLDRFIDRADRGGDDLEIVADQRRQQARGAEAAVRCGDGGDGLDARRIVEQHAATAVDLRVDKARQQHRAAAIDDLGAGRRLRRNRAYRTGRDGHGQPFAQALGQQDASVDERRLHHSVSVTLARCGGRSGSRPRVTASALAKR